MTSNADLTATLGSLMGDLNNEKKNLDDLRKDLQEAEKLVGFVKHLDSTGAVLSVEDNDHDRASLVVSILSPDEFGAIKGILMSAATRLVKQVKERTT
jgi:hypothetical protein